MKKVLIICFALLMSATCAFAASETIDELIAQLEGKTPEEITQAREEKDELAAVKEEIEQAKKNLRMEKDQFSGTIWIYSKKTPMWSERSEHRSIFIYAYEVRSGIGMEFSFGFVNSEWISTQEIYVNVDGDIYRIDMVASTKKPFYGSEYYQGVLAGKSRMELFNRIVTSEKSMVRFVGRHGVIDFVVSKKQKEAIADVLRYYDAVEKLFKLQKKE